jgi:hypothetical protein
MQYYRRILIVVFLVAICVLQLLYYMQVSSQITSSPYSPLSKIPPWLVEPSSLEPPGTFAFENPRPALYAQYGVHLSKDQFAVQQFIATRLVLAVCQQTRDTQQPETTNRPCMQRQEVTKCITCGNDWYSAVTLAGAAAGRVNNGIHLFTNYNRYTQMDIVVPAVGPEDRLIQFCHRLGRILARFKLEYWNGASNGDMQIRLVVPKNQVKAHGEPSTLTEFDLARLAKLEDESDVVMPPLDLNESKDFSRAKVLNKLFRRACSTEDCLVVVLDVDMDVLTTDFFRNCLAFVKPKASIYFPIVWSEVNPHSKRLAEKFFTFAENKPIVLPTHSIQSGVWRSKGYGMYALSGYDGSKYEMNEEFVGWGGEDKDFWERIRRHLHIVRKEEAGLVHKWHPKDCSGTSPAQYKSCLGSLSSTEGGALGLYLRILEAQARADPRKYEQLPFLHPSWSKEQAKPGIFIAVTTSRKASRASAILNTWATQLPKNIFMSFFVGQPGEGVEESSDHLFRDVAEKQDPQILPVTVLDVPDDEYPPVRKNVAMIKRATELGEDLRLKFGVEIGWIMKVDDDTYVNTDELNQLLTPMDFKSSKVLGKRGSGRPQDREGLQNAGLNKPFCMGGPGYALTQALLQKLVPVLDNCVVESDRSEWRQSIWHSDTVVGLCILKHTGVGCWDKAEKEDKFYRRRFKNLYTDSDMTAILGATKEEISGHVTIHPFKEAQEMKMFHSLVQQQQG